MVPLHRSEPLSPPDALLRTVSRAAERAESGCGRGRFLRGGFGKRAASGARSFRSLRRRGGRAGNLCGHGGWGEMDLLRDPVIRPGAPKIPGVGLLRGLEGRFADMDRPRCHLSRGESPSCRVAGRPLGFRRNRPRRCDRCPVCINTAGCGGASFPRASEPHGTHHEQETSEPRGDPPGNRWGQTPRAKGWCGRL